MKMRLNLFNVVVLTLLSNLSFGQNPFENSLRHRIDSLFYFVDGYPTELYSNDAPQSFMIPSGWGGYGTYLFGYVGGAYPEVYTKKKIDMLAAVGFCIGNPEKFVNLAISVNMGSLRRFTDFSANFSISRSIYRGSSITVGGLQLFANPNQSDAPGATFYIAFSHAFQGMPSKTPGYSKLSYTLGVGNGRFLTKSGKDIETGKGKYGTAVFGGISYEVLQHVNLNADWSGMNLGLSVGVRPFKTSLSFGIGVTNLTGYSADMPSMIFSIGYPLLLNRNKLKS